MSDYPRAYVLTEDAESYYIGCRQDQREPIRQIEGRKWDPAVNRWIVPRTAKSYDTLLGIVKDDCLQFDVSRPDLVGEKAMHPISVLLGECLWNQLHPDVRQTAEEVSDFKDVPRRLRGKLEQWLADLLGEKAFDLNSKIAEAQGRKIIGFNEKNWAHQIRLEGNYFVHWERPSPVDELRAVSAMTAMSCLLADL